MYRVPDHAKGSSTVQNQNLAFICQHGFSLKLCIPSPAISLTHLRLCDLCRAGEEVEKAQSTR
jgi:hypothetical protein